MIDAVDLFCGAGGLTAGLRNADIDVLAGYDIDLNCRYAYSHNNNAEFFNRDVELITAEELLQLYRPGRIKLLAGCAPCQPFSTYTQGKDKKTDKKWPLLYAFKRLIEEINPELITMENVPDVTKHKVYHDFVGGLQNLGYHVWAGKVSCDEYGLPQKRRRHVLLASALGPIELIPATHTQQRNTVFNAIGNLPPLSAGEHDPYDPLHRTQNLSELNLARIRASIPGGTWNDWPRELLAACHSKKSGKSYSGVYGRMEWDKPSPTMTTLCYGYGNGRFGHPIQDRGLSLREAALLQSFPNDYQFHEPGERVNFKAIGKMIGNAVPVRLGEVIGQSLQRHLAIHAP